MFDVFIGSVFTYGCPIWGFTKSKEIERVQLKVCKSILGVKQTTSNAAVYGELGRFPLFKNRLVANLKYWLKSTTTENIILKTLYKSMINDDNHGMNNWVTSIKQVLNEYGFNYVWLQPETVNHKHFIELFKQRISDCYVQKWRADI